MYRLKWLLPWALHLHHRHSNVTISFFSAKISLLYLRCLIYYIYLSSPLIALGFCFGICCIFALVSIELLRIFVFFVYHVTCFYCIYFVLYPALFALHRTLHALHWQYIHNILHCMLFACYIRKGIPVIDGNTMNLYIEAYNWYSPSTQGPCWTTARSSRRELKMILSLNF